MITITKIKKARQFQVEIVIADSVSGEQVRGFIDLVNLIDFETKLATLTDNQIKNGVLAEYTTILRTIN